MTCLDHHHEQPQTLPSDGSHSLKFDIIVALSQEDGIGYEQNLPWKKLTIDMTVFRLLTTLHWKEKVDSNGENFIEWSPSSSSLSLNPLKINDSSNNNNSNNNNNNNIDDDLYLQNVVIMGRKTFESVKFLGIPPFAHRHNFVLTRNPSKFHVDDKIHAFPNLDAALNNIRQEIYLSVDIQNPNPNDCLDYQNGDVVDHQSMTSRSPHSSRFPVVQQHILVIGGGQIFEEALHHSCCDNLFVTQLFDHDPILVDSFFPKDYKKNFKFIKNITHDLLIFLENWTGTGKLTKKVIQENLSRADKSFVKDNGYKYKFLWYKRK